VLANRALFESSRLPVFLLEKKENFDHWLMHGAHPDDAAGFSADDLDAASRSTLLKVVEAYIEAGFKDPGIGFVRHEEHLRLEEIKKRYG
jgi:hypothetical protein